MSLGFWGSLVTCGVRPLVAIGRTGLSEGLAGQTKGVGRETPRSRSEGGGGQWEVLSCGPQDTPERHRLFLLSPLHK